MWTHNNRPITLPTPPASPREWTISLPIPDGVEPGDHTAHDCMAADLAPSGYVVAGTIPVSRRDAPRDAVALRSRQWWRVRVTYHPSSWVRPMAAPVEVYAAAQCAGLTTDADDVMCADHDGIQYRTPDGRPTWRYSRDWASVLPAHVRHALSELRSISRRRRIGYMHGRPDTGRAMLVAEADQTSDDRRYERAQQIVREWVRANHPAVMA